MKKFLGLVIISLSLIACSSVTVNNVYNHTYNFTKITSYKIVKEMPRLPSGESVPSATFRIIKNAIDLEMTKKSYGKNNQLADFGITWHTALNDDVYTSADSLESWQDAFSENEANMLIIDIVDLESNNVVWRGWAKNVLNSQNLEERIKEAVEEILALFPPEHPMGLDQP